MAYQTRTVKIGQHRKYEIKMSHNACIITKEHYILKLNTKWVIINNIQLNIIHYTIIYKPPISCSPSAGSCGVLL